MAKPIDIDNYKMWLPEFDKIITNCLPHDFKIQLLSFRGEYREDYEEFILGLGEEIQIYLEINQWINSNDFIGFHSTRLTESEAIDIQNIGLISLPKQNRANRLLQAIRTHHEGKVPTDIESTLDSKIIEYQDRDHGGIFFSLSKNYLRAEASHYLYFGPEFDQIVIGETLGGYAKKCLRKFGKAAFVSYSFCGSHFEKPKNYNDIVEILTQGNRPELESMLFAFWVYWLRGCKMDSHAPNLGAVYIQRETPLPPANSVQVSFISDKEYSTPQGLQQMLW